MRTSYKFLAFGALFGFMFPVIATVIELVFPTARPVADNIWGIHTNDPLVMIIDTAPFFLGLAAYFIGQRQEKSENINKDLQESLAKLQETQKRLLEQEKIRSEFELSSQIAHELKNPLNFIINFSQISMDLVNDCVLPGNEDPAFEEMSGIKKDLYANLEVINKHGQRSGDILKQLLRVDNRILKSV